MGLIEKIFLKFLSMRAVDHQGLGQFAPKGLDWQDLSGGAPGALDISTYYMVSEDFFP